MNVLSIVLIILFFGLLIAIHEFGHFIAAKLMGVKVNEFAIGMGPKLFSREKGETLYSLRAFPIGGFCAMEGEGEGRPLVLLDSAVIMGFEQPKLIRLIQRVGF